MTLNYASYFGAKEEDLRSLVDFPMNEWMPDGGFKCNSNSIGAVHSSVHTTLSVLEGIRKCRVNGYSYRIAELQEAATACHEFLLVHRLFRAHRTGEVIRPSFLHFRMEESGQPSRWITLRALVA